MDIFSNLIENFAYFTVSLYITYAILTLMIPTIIIRLLRIFPYYVKNGDLGDQENCLLFGADNRDMRTQIRDIFTETHPAAICYDSLSFVFIIVVLYLTWGLVPFIVIGRLIWLGVRKLANHMRNQYLKKQHFHSVLKGD